MTDAAAAPPRSRAAAAKLYLVTWIAKADGKLSDEEREAIEAVIAEAGLADVIDAQQLFADDFDPETEIRSLTSEEQRLEVFRAAYAVAYADGSCSKAEAKRLRELREALRISAQHEIDLERWLAARAAAFRAARVRFDPLADPHARDHAIGVETRRAAIQSAVLGSFPIPVLSIATDLAIVALQVQLVQDIAAMHGRAVDATAARELLTTAGLTTLRIAASNMLKLLPGVGSLVSAAAAYAATHAVGRVFDRHFSREGGFDPPSLRAAMRTAEAEGRAAFRADEAEVEARRTELEPAIEQMAESARKGALAASELVDKTRERHRT